jgi:hypothetical protein
MEELDEESKHVLKSAGFLNEITHNVKRVSEKMLEGSKKVMRGEVSKYNVE